MMATTRSPAVTLTITTVLFVLLTASYGYRGRLVGGKTEIKDVKANKEVQELGRFSVEEYNQALRLWWPSQLVDGGERLRFIEVVAAERQVVAGIKYYLKISATQKGVDRMFDSVVVVKPWLNSKELLNFGLSGAGLCISDRIMTIDCMP